MGEHSDEKVAAILKVNETSLTSFLQVWLKFNANFIQIWGSKLIFVCTPISQWLVTLGAVYYCTVYCFNSPSLHTSWGNLTIASTHDKVHLQQLVCSSVLSKHRIWERLIILNEIAADESIIWGANMGRRRWYCTKQRWASGVCIRTL